MNPVQGDFDRQEPEQFVRELFKSIDDQDWSSLSGFLHDEAVYERPGYAPFVGKAAILHFYLSARIVASGCHVVERVLGDGKDIACWGSFTGMGRDGRSLKAGFADVYRLRDGRIDMRRTFFDSPAI